MREILENWRKTKRKYEDDSVLDGIMPEVIPGEKELGRLQRGIAEKKKEIAYCEPGNPYRDKEGRFTDPSKAPGSMTSGYWEQDKGRPGGCRRGKMSRKSSNKSTQITKHPCGRARKDGGKARYRCYDGKKLWENDGNGYIRILEKDLGKYILEIMNEVFERLEENVRVLDEQTSAITDDNPKMRQICNKKGYQSYKQFLTAISTLKKAQDGKLGEKT